MGRITAFIIGGLAGACAALALAPRTGAETRALVLDQAAVCKDKLQGAAGADPQQMYQDVVESATEFAQGAADQVVGKVQEMTGAKSEDDELRQKIEAARQRIAAQVVKNAEESRAAVDGAEAVEEVQAVEAVDAAEEA